MEIPKNRFRHNTQLNEAAQYPFNLIEVHILDTGYTLKATTKNIRKKAKRTPTWLIYRQPQSDFPSNLQPHKSRSLHVIPRSHDPAAFDTSLIVGMSTRASMWVRSVNGSMDGGESNGGDSDCIRGKSISIIMALVRVLAPVAADAAGNLEWCSHSLLYYTNNEWNDFCEPRS